MKRIMSIAELGVNDIPIAGGKAANLGELTVGRFQRPWRLRADHSLPMIIS